jgi:hypothetical protein
MKKYLVKLEPSEREQLEKLTRVGKSAAYRIRRAQVLLAVDQSEQGPGQTDEEVARTLHLSVRSLETVRKRFVEEGLEAVLSRKKQCRPSVVKMFDGEKEAKLIALACGPVPEGRTHWTMELLANQVVVLKIVEHCSAETVRRTLQKTTSSRGVRRCGAFLPGKVPSLSALWRMC